MRKQALRPSWLRHDPRGATSEYDSRFPSRPRSAGFIGLSEKTILIARHHARHCGPDHRRDPRLRVVVPRLQLKGDLPAGLCVLRPHRAHRLVCVAFIPLYVMGLMGMTRRMQHYDIAAWRPWLLAANQNAGAQNHKNGIRAAILGKRRFDRRISIEIIPQEKRNDIGG
jgi:hypothetical protein